MKKVLLTVIATIALCGSIFAQYESHWPEFSDGPFEDQGGIVAAFIVNGHIITIEDEGWDAYEVAPFVGDELRGNNMFLFDGVTTFGDTYPTLDGYPIYYTTPGEVVSFKMYDHINGILYEDCEILYMGEPLVIYTGEDHFEGWEDSENPVFLSFGSATPVTFTKDILGYTAQKDRYYLLSSPIGEVDPTEVENMLENDYDLYAFDQTNLIDAENNEYREWLNYQDAPFNLEVGKGYLYANSEDVTLTFTGNAYEEAEIEIPLVYDANCFFPGWNLLGNPYGDSIIIWSDFYVMNEDGNEIIESGEVDGVGPMEGFFVIAEGEGESLTIENPIGGGGEPMHGKIVLNVGRNAGRVIDRASIRFGEGRSMRKIMLNENNTKVYIPQDNNRFAVARSAEVGEMPVNFEASENGNYTITVNPHNLEMNYMHLIDNMTGADIDLLANPSYSFDARTTDYASRFRLVFATGNSEDNFAFFNNGNLVVSNDGNATLQVIDVNGRILNSESINGSTSISMNVASGVYMIRLINGNNVKTQKMVVR